MHIRGEEPETLTAFRDVNIFFSMQFLLLTFSIREEQFTFIFSVFYLKNIQINVKKWLKLYYESHRIL